jgi:hypothetical protein
VSFAAITLCVASQRVFVVVFYFVMTQSGNFWIHPHFVTIAGIGLCIHVGQNEVLIMRILHLTFV